MPGTTTYLGITYPSSTDNISATDITSFATAVDAKAFKEPGEKLTSKGQILTRSGTAAASTAGTTLGTVVTALSLGTTSQVLQFGETTIRWADQFTVDPALTYIAAATVGTATGTVTLSNIPGTYSHLVIRATAKTNFSGISDLGIRFNDDAGTAYDSTIVNFVSNQTAGVGTGTPTSLTNQTSIPIGALAGTFTANTISYGSAWAAIEATVYNYSSTTLSRYVSGEALGAFGFGSISRVVRQVSGTNIGGSIISHAWPEDAGSPHGMTGPFTGSIRSNLATLARGSSVTMNPNLSLTTRANATAMRWSGAAVRLYFDYRLALYNDANDANTSSNTIVVSGWAGASASLVNGTFTVTDYVASNLPSTETYLEYDTTGSLPTSTFIAGTATAAINVYTPRHFIVNAGASALQTSNATTDTQVFYGGTMNRHYATHGGVYKSTGTAVTSISFIASGSFDANTVFTLYGVK